MSKSVQPESDSVGDITAAFPAKGDTIMLSVLSSACRGLFRAGDDLSFD